MIWDHLVEHHGTWVQRDVKPVYLLYVLHWWKTNCTQGIGYKFFGVCDQSWRYNKDMVEGMIAELPVVCVIIQLLCILLTQCNTLLGRSIGRTDTSTTMETMPRSVLMEPTVPFRRRSPLIPRCGATNSMLPAFAMRLVSHCRLG